jgi:AraC-like DNA-binding protein
MDKLSKIIDNSTINKYYVFRSENFRTPSKMEMDLGLWVDRIGARTDNVKPDKMRLLGLYAAVHIEKGNGIFISRTKGSMKATAGDIMLVFPDEPSLYYPETDTWKTKWIVWDGKEAHLLQKLGILKQENPLVHSYGAFFDKIFTSLQFLMRREDVPSLLERKNSILSLILHLNRSLDKNKDSFHSSLIIEKALKRIQDNTGGNEIPIPALAKECNLSQTHFRRLFKAYTGRSPKDYMLSLKISEAKKMLSEGRNIKECAELLGFNDVFYFMRTFKNMSGMTAGNFMKTLSS